MTAKSKYFNAIVLEDETLRSEGKLKATGEERDGRPNSTISIDPRTLNPQGDECADVPSHEKCLWSFTEKYKIGTWNVRSLYAGKTDVVLHEMIRTNVKILGLSEVRWSGKGHFQSGDFKIFVSGQETTRANGVAIICSNETAQTVLRYNPFRDRIISVKLQGKPLNLTFIQVYAPRLKLRKLKKVAQPLRFDMGKISTEYKVEISNRFQALDLLTSEQDKL